MGLGSRDLAKLIHVAAASALTVGSAYAADPEFGASVGARLASSNNVELAPPGFERSEQIAELNGGFTFSRTAPRLSADVTYSLQSVLYNELKDLNETYNTLDAS